MNNSIHNLLEDLYVYAPSVYEHSINVANIAVSFGKHLNLNDDELEELRLAGLLHDIGVLKSLNKPASITKEEYEIIKNHPIDGLDLLIDKGFKDKKILNSVLFHHERYDGLGYPYGIKADSIPLIARIITICDSYDTMILPEIYKTNQDLDVKKEFEINAGTQFDPDYALKFLDYLKKEKNQLIRNRNRK